MKKFKPRLLFSLPSFEDWPLILRLLLQPLNRKKRILFGIFLTILLFGVSYLDVVTGNRLDFKPIYGIIVLLAFALFRFQGLWWLLGVMISYQATFGIRYLHPSPHLEFLDDIVALFSFGAIGLLIAMISQGMQEIKRSHELLQRDLLLAGQTQKQILPPPTHLSWVKIEGLLRPTGEVGGDFYLIEPLQENLVFFAIGDVQGKGVSAALTMVRVMALFLEDTKEIEPLSLFCKRMNEKICTADFGMVTVFLGTMKKIAGDKVLLKYVKAGHEEGLLIKRNGQWHELKGDGLPFGVSPNENYKEESVILEPYDCLLFYTDGLADARNPFKQTFGRETLVQQAAFLAKKAVDEGIGEWLNQLFNLVDAHRGEGIQEDDMAALGILILPQQ
jgi:serine phosphatase RsbU (regulator of sigma subunit)